MTAVGKNLLKKLNIHSKEINKVNMIFGAKSKHSREQLPKFHTIDECGEEPPSF